MRGELFLLALACVSFVQVRGDHNSENPLQRGMLTEANLFAELYKTEIQPSNREVNKTSDEELEDAISSSLFSVNTMHTLIVKLLLQMWTNLQDIRKIQEKNHTDYTRIAEEDRKRIENTLYRVADKIKDEARELESYRIIVQCINKVEHKAKEDVASYLRTFVAKIRGWNSDFNKTYPELPFLLTEDELKEKLSHTIQSLKGCNDKECVVFATLKYAKWLDEFYESYLEMVTKAYFHFTEGQGMMWTFYRKATKDIQKIGWAAIEDMRECMYIRPAVLDKLLGFS